MACHEPKICTDLTHHIAMSTSIQRVIQEIWTYREDLYSSKVHLWKKALNEKMQILEENHN